MHKFLGLIWEVTHVLPAHGLAPLSLCFSTLLHPTGTNLSTITFLSLFFPSLVFTNNFKVLMWWSDISASIIAELIFDLFRCKIIPAHCIVQPSWNSTVEQKEVTELRSKHFALHIIVTWPRTYSFFVSNIDACTLTVGWMCRTKPGLQDVERRS